MSSIQRKLDDLTWTEFKALLPSWACLKMLETSTGYFLKGMDNSFEFCTYIEKTDPANSDQTDFETNYKSRANMQMALIQQSFTAKSLPNGKKLFARNTGFQQALNQGANTITYTATYPWAKMTGIEVVNCEALDTVDLKVYDTNTGTYSGIPNLMLNQFAFTHNLPKDFYHRVSKFDADLYASMIIQITYNSISAKTVGINILLDEVK